MYSSRAIPHSYRTSGHPPLFQSPLQHLTWRPTWPADQPAHLARQPGGPVRPWPCNNIHLYNKTVHQWTPAVGWHNERTTHGEAMTIDDWCELRILIASCVFFACRSLFFLLTVIIDGVSRKFCYTNNGTAVYDETKLNIIWTFKF